MTDSNLQERAGLNVGNQPAGLTFLAKAHAASVDCPSGQRVTLVAAVEGVLRCMGSAAGFTQGLLHNASTTDTYDYTIFFEDGQGNEMEIESGSINPESTQEIESEIGEEGLFPLCGSGEKFTIQIALAPPSEV